MSIDWLAELLRPPDKEPPEEPHEEPTEEPTGVEEFVLNELTDASSSVTVTSADGTVLAKSEIATVNTDNFDIRWRLRIPADVWEYLVLVCDGKSIELTTTPLSDNRYKISKTVRGYTLNVVEEEEILELREFPSTRVFLVWVEQLTPEQVEAYRQIYFDRWCFDTASHKDRMYFELLDEELQSKKE